MKLQDRIDCYADNRIEDIPSSEKIKDLLSMLFIPGSLTLFSKKIVDSRYPTKDIGEKLYCYFMEKMPEAVILDGIKLVGYIKIAKGLADLF
jgi:hypothetical protein